MKSLPVHALLPSLIAASLLCGGTTNAQGQSVAPTQPATPPSGVIYYLPRLELVIRVTRELERCDGSNLEVKQTAEITGENVIEDPGRYYLLATENVERFFHSNDITVNQNRVGTLASVKNTSADKTGEFIVSVFSSIAKLAAAAAGVPLGAVPASAPSDICNAATRQRLIEVGRAKDEIKKNDEAVEKSKDALTARPVEWSAARDKLKEEIAKLEEALERRRKALAALTAKAKGDAKDAARGEDKGEEKAKKVGEAKKAVEREIARLEQELARKNAAVASGDAKLAADLKAIGEQISRLEEKQTKLQARIVTFRQALTREDLYRFSPAAGAYSLRLDPSNATLQAWFRAPGLDNFANNAARADWICADDPQEVNSCGGWLVIPRATTSYIGVVATSGTQASSYPENGSDPKGIVFRQPVSAEVRICAVRSCVDAAGQVRQATQQGELLLLDRRLFSQFGRVGMMPYASHRLFQTLTVDMELHDAGGIKKLTYTTNARSEKAAETFTKSLDEFVKLRDIKDKEKVQDSKRRKDEIEAETTVLEAELKKLDAEQRLRDKRKELKSGAGG